MQSARLKHTNDVDVVCCRDRCLREKCVAKISGAHLGQATILHGLSCGSKE